MCHLIGHRAANRCHKFTPNLDELNFDEKAREPKTRVDERSKLVGELATKPGVLSLSPDTPTAEDKN